MKKVLLTAIAVSAMAAATPAVAAPANFDVTATVEAKCSYTGGTIEFGTISTVDTTGMLVGGQSASSTGQTGFYCNGANTTLTLDHEAMTTAATAIGFTNSIDFTPAVSVGGVDQRVGDALTAVAFGAQAGTLVVHARNLTATDKVIAGAYEGTITLTLAPAT